MIKEDMKSNLNVLIVSAFLIITATFMAVHTPFLTKKAFAVDDNWYVGEGVTKNMYLKYKMSHFDTNNGREFTMVI